jgi:hypothetical protein
VTTNELDAQSFELVTLLTEEGSQFFSRLTVGQAPGAQLLPKDDGSEWLKSPSDPADARDLATIT